MSFNRRRDPTRTEKDDGAFLDPTAVSSSCQSVDRSVAVDEVQTRVNDPGAQLRETMLRAYIDFLLSEDIQCSIRAGNKRTREQLNALFRREWKKTHGYSIDEDRVLESLFPLVSVTVPVDHNGWNAASEPDLASQAEAPDAPGESAMKAAQCLLVESRSDSTTRTYLEPESAVDHESQITQTPKMQKTSSTSGTVQPLTRKRQRSRSSAVQTPPAKRKKTHVGTPAVSCQVPDGFQHASSQYTIGSEHCLEDTLIELGIEPTKVDIQKHRPDTVICFRYYFAADGKRVKEELWKGFDQEKYIPSPVRVTFHGDPLKKNFEPVMQKVYPAVVVASTAHSLKVVRMNTSGGQMLKGVSDRDLPDCVLVNNTPAPDSREVSCDGIQAWDSNGLLDKSAYVNTQNVYEISTDTDIWEIATMSNGAIQTL